MKNQIDLISQEKQIVLNENEFLKKKIVLKEKEKTFIFKKKNNFDSHSFHVSKATIP